MKTSLRKYLSLVMVLCVAFVCLFAVNVKAASEKVDWTAAPTSASASTVVWEGSTFAITLAQGSSQTAANNYLGGTNAHTRIYKGQTLTFAPNDGYQIDSIAITATSSSYAEVFTSSTWSNATASNNGTAVSVTPIDGTKDVAMTVVEATRATQIVVTTSSLSDPKVTINGSQNINTTTTFTAKTANLTGEVAWSSSDNDIATVANGVVTPVAMGRTTITAESLADSVSDSIEVTVWPDNSSTITVAQAKEIIDFTSTTKSAFEYTVEGEITSIETEYSSEDDNISVFITDNTGSLLLYGLSGGDDLSVGMNIRATGNLVYYSKTSLYEMAAGGTYEIVVDSTIQNMMNSLNALEGKASLGFKYTEVTTPVQAKAVTDTLDNALIGISGTTYKEWSNKQSDSSAVYAGQSAGGNSSIQLRSSNSNSGIVTTVSGGLATTVTVEWNSNTSKGRTLNVYGSNTPFTSPTELYGNDVTAEKLGTIVNGTSTSLTIEGKYEYIAIRSANGALYLDSVQIEWAGKAYTEYSYTNVDFRLRCGVDAAIDDIANEYGIKVTINGKSRTYDMSSDFWGKDADFVFVTIDLGDVINHAERLDAEISIQAYAVVDEIAYYSEAIKTFTIAELVSEYYNSYKDHATFGEAITALYGLLEKMGKIA